MMSGNASDPAAESSLRQALERRTNQTREFNDWINTGAPDSNQTASENDTFVLHQPILSPQLQQYFDTFANQRGPDSFYYRNISGFIKGPWAAHNTSSWYRQGVSESVTTIPVSESASDPASETGTPTGANETEHSTTPIDKEETPEIRRGLFPWFTSEASDRKATFNIRETDPSNNSQSLFVKGTLDLEIDDVWSTEIDIQGVQ
jgi:hypothetical protein